MVEKLITSSRNVVDFARYRAGRNSDGMASALVARACRYCGAALLEGESERDCSSAFNSEASAARDGQRKFYAD
jgi:hypothetical protein